MKCARRSPLVVAPLIAAAAFALIVTSAGVGDAAEADYSTAMGSSALPGPIPDPPGQGISSVSQQAPDLPAQPPKGAKVQPADSELRLEAQNNPLEMTVVEIHHAVGARAAVEQLVVEIGGTINGPAGDRAVEALVPADQVNRLESADAVDYVIAPGMAFPLADLADPSQAVSGQEISLTNAAAWHAAGLRGQGVRVGIIDSFSTPVWNSAIASGDLPGAPAGTFCRVLGTTCNIWGNSNHGVAVAEVVHELAPQATLYLATVRSAADFQAAIDYFFSQGVKVVTRSETAEYDGPGDGTGPMADVIAYAVSKGMVYLNSAGNSAGNTAAGRPGGYWRGSWSDLDNDGWLNFAGDDELLETTCAYFNGVRWSDWGANRTDYDVFLYDQTGTVNIGSSQDDQQAGLPPIERLNGTCSGGTIHIAIKRYHPGAGTAGDVLELMVNAAFLEHWSNPGSATGPMADSASSGALSIGAIDPATSGSIAQYSSQGPTNDGRIKPDLSAPSCVSSNSYAPNCFNGTSAASPVAAGVAALVAGSGMVTGPAAIATYLRNATVDRGAAGIDNVYGKGQLVLPAPPLPFSVGPTPSVAGSPPMTLTGYTPVPGVFHYGLPEDLYFYGAGRTEVMWASTLTGSFVARTTRQQTSTAVPVAGDFNGDGKDDLFWYIAGAGAEQYWRGSQTGVFTSVTAPVVNGTYRPVVGDYNGDGYDDIYWYASGPGSDGLWRGSATGTFTTGTGRSQAGVGYTPLAGDYNGDGRDDLLWYAAGATAEQLWRGAANFSFPSAAVGQVGGTYRPVTGDFNGDGKCDIFWHVPGTGAEGLWRGTASGFTTTGPAYPVNGTYVPYSGRFNNDTKDDIFLYAAGSTADVLLLGK